MRKIHLFTLSLILGFVACKEKPKSIDKFNPNASVSVDVTVVETQKVQKQIEVNGSVLANDYVELHPEVNGRITFLQVPEGKLIKAGTIIARLNDADLQAQLSKAKVQLD